MAEEKEKMFPIMSDRDYKKPHPSKIPWWLADQAYSKYAKKCGDDQSLERLAERGGFYAAEMDEFRPGWVEECSGNEKLKLKVKELEEQNDRLMNAVWTITMDKEGLDRSPDKAIFLLQEEIAKLREKLSTSSLAREAAQEALEGLVLPCTRTDYSVQELDAVVTGLAMTGLHRMHAALRGDVLGKTTGLCDVCGTKLLYDEIDDTYCAFCYGNDAGLKEAAQLVEERAEIEEGLLKDTKLTMETDILRKVASVIRELQICPEGKYSGSRSS